MNKNYESIEEYISQSVAVYGYRPVMVTAAGGISVVGQMPAVIVYPVEVLACDGVMDCRITSKVEIMTVKSCAGYSFKRYMDLAAEMRHELVSIFMELQDCCNILEVSDLKIEEDNAKMWQGETLRMRCTAKIISNYNPDSSIFELV